MSQSVSKLFEVLLVGAALSTAALAWKGSFAGEPSAPRPIRVENWREELAFDRRVGLADAPFRLVVWTDYQCPACRQLEVELKELRLRLGDSLSVAYRFYPLPAHPLAFGAAVLAECAHRKGQFAAMHEALFHPVLTGDSLPVESLAARVAGANAKDLRACAATRDVRAVVDNERRIGDSLGFRGTPYVQIGDKLTFGGMAAGTLEQSLRSAR